MCWLENICMTGLSVNSDEIVTSPAGGNRCFGLISGYVPIGSMLGNNSEV